MYYENNPSNIYEEDTFMIRIHKNKKGFTLIEMILVIAIIVILASVLALGISNYIQKSERSASSLSLHNMSISSASVYIEQFLNR